MQKGDNMFKLLGSFMTNRSQEDLKYFQSLKYDIILKEVKGQFYLTIPEIPIVEKDKDLITANKKLIDSKNQYIEDLFNAGLEKNINLPKSVAYKSKTLYQLKLFTYKLLIICFCFGITFAIAGQIVINKASRISAGTVVKNVSKQVIATIEKVSDMPDLKKRKLINKIRRIMIDIKPILEVISDSSKTYKNIDNSKE